MTGKSQATRRTKAALLAESAKMRAALERCASSFVIKPPVATAEASVEHSSFGAAWRDYVANIEFNSLPEHDRALIRVAFVSGWRARGIANG